MSIPGFLMVDRAAVRRQTMAQNSMGAMTSVLAAAHISNQECRLDYLRARRYVAPNVTAEAGDPLVFFPAVLDIQMSDVVELTTSEGDSIRIMVVSPKNACDTSAHHMEVVGKLIQ